MTASPTLTLLSQIHGGTSLQHALSEVEAQVRQQPQAREARWALIELLCTLGQWERAQQQLQSFARLFADASNATQTMGGLVQAEAQRQLVFAGHLLPTPLASSPAWMTDLGRALHLGLSGQLDAADELREAALASATSPAGWCSLQDGTGQTPADADTEATGAAPLRFEWLADTDSRFGPVLEVMHQGQYRWLPLSDVASLTLRVPQRLGDLVWSPALLKTRPQDGQAAALLQVHIPARYPGTEHSSNEQGSAQREALLLGRLSRWTDVGRSAIVGLGQRTWMCDSHDWPQLNIRYLEMDALP
ncbi:MAG: hypothetical protein C4K60_14365 [Ideonella sp. MAG2]|nr:MAG: hypothetical protein C4K60_14365 [Ideonella sp. MAG2]